MTTTTAHRTLCWHCRHMIAGDPRSTVVTCGMDSRGSTTFTRGGGRGCDAWEREPGIDDDDWNPPGTSVIAPCVPEPPPATRVRSRGTDGWWTEPLEPPRPPAPAPIPFFVLKRDPFGGILTQDDD